jgi:hypothetical protein
VRTRFFSLALTPKGGLLSSDLGGSGVSRRSAGTRTTQLSLPSPRALAIDFTPMDSRAAHGHAERGRARNARCRSAGTTAAGAVIP